jgi:diaminohydroxyphosphoribosylaminopyrimidine deaminase/5-amino-6-(5-phosphoribosylamino)uracil reductase
MEQAIRLSLEGYPAPNPHVGCVLVKEGRLVGSGFHEYAGGPHAEAVALEMAGDAARGAEAFVTLEPCAHHGRQPPCSDALNRAGIAKVWIATADPNPRVVGGGADRLREAGIAVEVGLLRDHAKAANRTWLFSMKKRRPFVALKAAMSLDGRIALPSGASKWITGEAARQRARLLRAELGAVLVGAQTVLRDDPALTARSPEVRNEPVRVVLDPHREVPDAAAAFDGNASSLRFVLPDKAKSQDVPLAGVNGEFDLHSLLETLWDRGTTGLLVEGGAKTISGFLRAGIADRLELFVGNVALGEGPSWLELSAEAELADLARWKLGSVQAIGDDVWMRLEPRETPA